MEIIAMYGLSNVGGIGIYDANDEYVVAGYNDDKPRNYKVYYTIKEGRAYFNWKRRRIYLDECMRVR